jgi:AcrR family transcriptional regulator
LIREKWKRPVAMSWKRKKEKNGERGYHHGNLREALIDAALALIVKKGPDGFTFAEAAREAGVSAAAPYRHFRDRDELVVEVARRGFERFEKALKKAWNKGRPDALSALKAVGGAYLKFARDDTALYSAMFESGIAPDADRKLKLAADAAFEVLRKASETVCEIIEESRRPPSMMVALHIWAQAHGVASLFARGDAARRSLPMQPEELLEAGILIYLDGLGIKR